MQASNNTQAEEDQLTELFQKVFMGTSTAQEGQLVFWHLINETFVFRAFNQQNAGAYAMEGKREIGLELLQRVGLSPKQVGLKLPTALAQIESSITSAGKLKETAK